MTEQLRPYPEYKDSGLRWFGRIPAHWEIRASKRLFTESGERARPDDQQLSATQSHGVVLQAEYERLVGRKVVRILHNPDKRKHVEKDDFVISMRSFQGGLERAWSRGAIRSSYVVLKPSKDIHVPYFTHLFKSYPYIQALTDMIFSTTYRDDAARGAGPFPLRSIGRCKPLGTPCDSPLTDIIMPYARVRARYMSLLVSRMPASLSNSLQIRSARSFRNRRNPRLTLLSQMPLASWTGIRCLFIFFLK